MINGDDDDLEKDLDGVRDDRVYGIVLMYKFVVVGGGGGGGESWCAGGWLGGGGGW